MYKLVLAVAVALALPACDSKTKTKTPESPAPQACAVDDDCTLTCETPGNCCRNPFCTTAATRAEASGAEAYNREHCTKEDLAACPTVGGMAPDYHPVPRCRAGRCVAENEPATTAPK